MEVKNRSKATFFIFTISLFPERLTGTNLDAAEQLPVVMMKKINHRSRNSEQGNQAMTDLTNYFAISYY